jgi:hypothetical protein
MTEVVVVRTEGIYLRAAPEVAGLAGAELATDFAATTAVGTGGCFLPEHSADL